MNLKIVVDENIPQAQRMFADLGEVIAVPGRTMSPADISGADVLLVRSVTAVNAQLLGESQLKFVGSATIGTDHVDTQWLASQGIPFASAPGCNADAVVDYDLCCLSQLLQQTGEHLLDKTVAVVGVGNVGSRLVARLEAMGVKVLKNDPLRAEREEGFISLTQALTQADIVCLHTPLTKEGLAPSYHLIGRAQLDLLKPGAILLNAGRGPVIAGEELKAFLQQRRDVRAVLDVWEHEPSVDLELAALVSIATPHIAGYSLEGKLRGSFMLKQAMAKQLGFTLKQQLEDFLPSPAIKGVDIDVDCDVLSLMSLQYDPYADDRRLRATLGLETQPEAFDRLRKQYPVRREFSALSVRVNQGAARKDLSAAGFNLI
ncbi:MAG: 4-phosphoerythronate dehydrogenase [Pseudomonadales bacterium]